MTEEWEVIFEPGSFVVVESIHGRRPERGTVDVLVERYDLGEASLDRTCANLADVVALLRAVGVSAAKASEKAPAIWAAMEDYLHNGPSSDG